MQEAARAAIPDAFGSLTGDAPGPALHDEHDLFGPAAQAVTHPAGRAGPVAPPPVGARPAAGPNGLPVGDYATVTSRA